MKKNIFFKSLVLSVSLFLVNCTNEDFEVLPNHLDTPATVYSSESNFRLAVDGAYDSFKAVYSGDTGNSVILADILADNLIINPQGRGTNRSAYEWSYTQQDGSVTTLYSNAYFVISRANVVLDNIGNVPYTSYMKNIEAEAKAIRAIAHFDLVRAYSKIPTQSADANGTLGIAYVTTYDPLIKTTRDATVSTTYSKIIADLEDALTKINTTNGDIGRLNKTSVLGYLSKVNLYKGDYDKAVSYGELCLASTTATVGSSTNFVNVWRDASDDGELFSLRNSSISALDNITVGVAYNQNSSGVRSESNVNYDLFLKYSVPGVTDLRKTAYIITAPYSSTLYNHVNKYRVRTGSSLAGVVDVKMLRMADVYLTLAEAHMKSTSPNATRSLQLLNSLRTQRYTPFIAGTEAGSALLTAIYNERRLEMAFENDRFWTLKRLGLPVSRSSYGSSVSGGGVDAPSGATLILPASSHRFVLPIPQDAINLNPAIQQNPGY